VESRRYHHTTPSWSNFDTAYLTTFAAGHFSVAQEDSRVLFRLIDIASLKRFPTYLTCGTGDAITNTQVKYDSPIALSVYNLKASPQSCRKQINMLSPCTISQVPFQTKHGHPIPGLRGHYKFHPPPISIDDPSDTVLITRA
jgi:hypothetical protein